MKTPENKKNELLTLVIDGLKGIENEIRKIEHDQEAVDELQHLQFIKSVLLKIRTNLIQNYLPVNSKFEPNIARIIIDSWPVNHPLGDQICEIEYQYRRLFKRI